MTRVVLFSDIDDTLMQTESKCPPDGTIKAVGFDRQGNPLSFATQQQLGLIELFHNNAEVIPVTGRNLDALKRTELGLDNAIYQVTSHGAMVYYQGKQLSEGWRHPLEHDDQQQQLLDIQKEVCQFVQAEQVEGRCHLVIDDDAPVYLSVKANRKSREKRWLQKLKKTFARDWHQLEGTIHLNGNNLAFLPAFADKANAVSFLKNKLNNKHNDCLFIGAGDSFTDQGFLSQCDFQIIPSDSQIANGYENN